MKIIVVGSRGVGTSLLIHKFVSNSLRKEPTEEDFFRKEIDVDDSPATLEISNLAGAEGFSAMKDLYYKSCQGFILVYSITDAQTFEDIKESRDQIDRVKDSWDYPLVLVGNKCDCEEERVVTTGDGEKLSRHWGVPFFETSAETNHNVYNVFAEIVRQIRQRDDKKRKNVCSSIFVKVLV